MTVNDNLLNDMFSDEIHRNHERIKFEKQEQGDFTEEKDQLLQGVLCKYKINT